MLKKWLVGVTMAAALLAACGDMEQQNGEVNETAYTSEASFTHEMEQVRASMDAYTVGPLTVLTEAQQQNGIAEHEIVLEAALTVQNDTAATVYFTPDVYVTVNDTLLNNEAERLALAEAPVSTAIAAGAAQTFTVAFRIPQQAYDEATTATMQIPVAYTMANSTSSGDALRDIAEWTLPIK